jgi:hypothetical protein
MKLSLESFLSKLLIILSFLFIIISCEESSNKFNLQSHLQSMMKFKAKTRTLLQNLYFSANKVDSQCAAENKGTMISHRCGKRKTNSTIKATRKTKFRHSVRHFSTVSDQFVKSQNDYIQYRYKNYQEIVDELYALAKKYPDYLKVDTAQKLYNLPNPGGFCDANKKK